MFQAVTEISNAAGKLAMSHFGTLTDASVEQKGPLDLVTVADRAVETFIQQQLLAAFPDDGIFGEEGASVPGTSGRTWVVDPIDGTFNFVRGGRQWAISVGLYADGQPVWGVVHAPAADIMITGGREDAPRLNGKELSALRPFDPDKAVVGVSLGGKCPQKNRVDLVRFLIEESGMMFRNCNSATHALIEVATGEVDGHVALGESTWDIMGMWPILTRLGAVSTLAWADQPLDQSLRYVIGKPEIVQKCRHLVT
ncbi:MAG: inositol monophosphatase [Rhodobacteraceae bacterium]|nr:inositol monophosphatase [Paracoccaceae bacterium]